MQQQFYFFALTQVHLSMQT